MDDPDAIRVSRAVYRRLLSDFLWLGMPSGRPPNFRPETDTYVRHTPLEETRRLRAVYLAYGSFSGSREGVADRYREVTREKRPDAAVVDWAAAHETARAEPLPLVVLHNAPDGPLSPSAADVEILRRLAEATRRRVLGLRFAHTGLFVDAATRLYAVTNDAALRPGERAGQATQTYSDLLRFVGLPARRHPRGAPWPVQEGLSAREAIDAVSDVYERLGGRVVRAFALRDDERGWRSLPYAVIDSSETFGT